MVREDEILYILSQDSWFIPSRKANKKQLKNADGTPMIDENGKEIEVAESYYKTLHNGTQLLIRYIISECVSRLYEIQRKKRVGKYTAIDGDWWDGIPKGLESKGCGLQDVRMYDYKDETIALWRRCDNLKYFYAKIVPDKGKETKWQAMKLSEVPIVIRNDFSTINPSGHEPYLPF